MSIATMPAAGRGQVRDGQPSVTESEPVSRPRALPALTGLRFAAAMLVTLYHCEYLLRGRTGITSTLSPVNIIAQGDVGVSFFFLLSGFILFYTYGQVGGEARLERRGFWRARFARIYPIYLIGLLLGALPYFWFWSAMPPGPVTVLGLSLLLLQSWLPSASNSWNSPGWSLSVETFFYACFPWVRDRLLTLPTRRIATALGLCWLALVGSPLLIAGLLGLSHVGQAIGSLDMHNLLTREPPLRLPEFVAGALLGALFVRRRAAPGKKGRGRVRDEAIAWGALAVVAAVLCLPLISRVYLQPYIIVDPVFAVLIYTCATAERSALVRLLSAPFCRLLGESSYAFYIVHLPLLYILGEVWTRSTGSSMESRAFVAAYLVTVVLVSVVLYRRVESPIRRILRGPSVHMAPAMSPALAHPHIASPAHPHTASPPRVV